MLLTENSENVFKYLHIVLWSHFLKMHTLSITRFVEHAVLNPIPFTFSTATILTRNCLVIKGHLLNYIRI